MFVCFIDYSKAFDTVKHKLLVDLLQSLGVDQAELWLLTSLYLNQKVDKHQTTSMTRVCGFSTFIFLVCRNEYEENRGHGGFQNGLYSGQ